MQIIHSLLWGVATPWKVRLELSLGFYVFHFRFVQVNFVFLLTDFITLLCILTLLPPGGSGWTIGVDQLKKLSTVWGQSDPGRRSIGLSYSLGLWDLSFCARFTSFHAHASLLTFFSFFVLLHSCCSHEQVFVKTLVHEFPISYSHTEWYLLFLTVQLHVHIRVFGAKVEILTHQ